MKVVIVGAGVAGLFAAHLLHNLNVDVVLVEASDQLGGRLRPYKGFLKDKHIDLGAEFLHGNRSVLHTVLNQMQQVHKRSTNASEITAENPWSYSFVYNWEKPSCEAYYSRGKLYRIDTKDPELAKMNEAIDAIYEYTPKANESDRSVLQFLRERNVPESVIPVADARVGATWGTTLDRLGLFDMIWQDNTFGQECGGDNFRLPDSYAPLHSLLTQIRTAQNVSVRLNWQAKQIDYRNASNGNNNNNIRITNQRGEVIESDYVLVTVPVSILRDGDIEFVPKLPATKVYAASKITMHSTIKIFCKFNRKFWPSDLKLVLADHWLVSQFWMLAENAAANEFIVCGYVTGEKGDFATKNFTDDQLVHYFLKLLDEAFGSNNNSSNNSNNPATASFVGSIVQNWGREPFVRGGYAYPAVGGRGLVQMLAEPVDMKLFFAGEATNLKYNGTVQSAMESALRAVSELTATSKFTANRKLLAGQTSKL